MTPYETLTAARALIANPDHWCQEDYAADNSGLACSPNDEDAYCHCALGAVLKVLDLSESALDVPVQYQCRAQPLKACTEALQEAARELYDAYVQEVNDGSAGLGMEPVEAHEAVLRIYDHAIASVAA